MTFILNMLKLMYMFYLQLLNLDSHIVIDCLNCFGVNLNLLSILLNQILFNFKISFPVDVVIVFL